MLYALVFIGLLGAGALAIFAGGWMALLVVLWQSRRDGRQVISRLLTPGLVVFVGAAVLLWFRLRTATYAHWDEFSHWGLITKFLVASKELPLVSTTVYLPQYRPGTALWHVFVTRVVPYSEGAVYFAHALLLLTALVLPLKFLGWRRWRAVLLSVVFGYVAVFVFGHGFQSLLVDHVLGAFFGASVLWYVSGEPTRARLVAMAAVVFTLPLWKEGGLPLAAVACAVPAVVEAVRVIRARREGAPAPAVRQAVFAVSVMAGAVSVADASWSLHVRRTFPTYETKTSTVTWSRISATVAGRRSDREQIILSKFRHALIHESVGNSRLAALTNAVLERAGLTPIVRNGDFSTTNLDGWHAFPTTDLDVFGYRLRVTRSRGPDTAAQATTTFPTRVGRRYMVATTYELRDTRSATLRVRNRQTVLAESASPEPKGQLVAEFTALSAATDLDIWLVAPTRGTYGFFDDIHVTEIASAAEAPPAAAADTSPPPIASTAPDDAAAPLVANGDFSTGVHGWQPYTTTRLDAVDGRLRASRRGGSDTAVQATTTIQTDIGRRYAASCLFTLNDTQSATVRVRAGIETLAEVTSTKPSGRLSTEFTAKARFTDVDIWLVTTLPGGHGFFDDVEIVPLDGVKPSGRGVLKAVATALPVADRQAPALAAAADVPQPRPRPARWSWVRPIGERATSPMFWGVLLAAAGVVLCFAAPRESRLPVWVTVGVLTAAAVVYILSLLSMYLYALSEQDALDLTSFGRYTAVYFLGWAFVLFGLAIQQSGGPRRRVAWFVAVALTGLAVATAPPASADWLLDKPTLRSERILIRSQMERVDRHVPLNESVSILWQQTQGFEFWILRYELAPRQSNLWNFAFGGPYYPGDVWTSDVSDTQFVETVVHFDFLMVAHADGLFWQRYGHLFAPSARGLTSALFRIRRRTDGGADFTLVTRL